MWLHGLGILVQSVRGSVLFSTILYDKIRGPSSHYVLGAKQALNVVEQERRSGSFGAFLVCLHQISPTGTLATSAVPPQTSGSFD